jgi:hypothetical protein
MLHALFPQAVAYGVNSDPRDKDRPTHIVSKIDEKLYDIRGVRRESSFDDCDEAEWSDIRRCSNNYTINRMRNRGEKVADVKLCRKQEMEHSMRVYQELKVTFEKECLTEEVAEAAPEQ